MAVTGAASAVPDISVPVPRAPAASPSRRQAPSRLLLASPPPSCSASPPPSPSSASAAPRPRGRPPPGPPRVRPLRRHRAEQHHAHHRRGDDGTQFFTLAFVNGAGCQWSLPNQSGWQSQVSALQAEGGDVSISFGGYTVDTDGTDLGAQCSSAAAMAAQVESVVTTFNVTHLDFDIESNEQYNTPTSRSPRRRSARSARGPAATASSSRSPTRSRCCPPGSPASGEGVLTTALANGFTPNIVNIMTMDYGTSGTEMGAAANQALDAAASQLESIYGISSSAAYAMLGNTPMIGQNDTSGRDLHARRRRHRRVVRGAAGHRAGSRSGPRAGTTTAARATPRASSTCSGISQSNGAFTQAFQPFTTGGSGGGGGTPTPTPDADAARPTEAPASLRGRLGQQHRLRLGQRGLLQRRQLDRQPVELRRGPRRRRRRLEQRRSLLTHPACPACLDSLTSSQGHKNGDGTTPRDPGACGKSREDRAGRAFTAVQRWPHTGVI